MKMWVVKRMHYGTPDPLAIVQADSEAKALDTFVAKFKERFDEDEFEENIGSIDQLIANELPQETCIWIGAIP